MRTNVMTGIVLAFLAAGQLNALAARESVAAPDGVAELKKTAKAFTEVAKKAIPAVVAITSQRVVEGGRPRYYRRGGNYIDEDILDWLTGGGFGGGRRSRDYVEQGGGSGFIISKDGYILTNNHVVGDADKIIVRLHDGRQLEAKRIGADPRSEVAVIKIEADNLPFLELGDSSVLEIGEWAIAVGNQFGFFSESLTVGVISAKGRSNLDLADYEDFIQTDASINPGNSGGPLLNIDGKVIGINTAIFTPSGGNAGIGLAIPINMARTIKDQLIKNKGKIIRGYIGVKYNPQGINEAMARSFGLNKVEGALVADVMKDSPAAQAGLKAGDVIVEIDKKPIPDTKSLVSTIALMAPGTRASLKVHREGKTQNVEVVIGTFPEDVEVNSSEVLDMTKTLGISVAALTASLAKKFGYDSEDEGIVVTAVEKNSPADRADIAAGNLILSVNRQVVRSTGDFNKAFAESTRTGRVLLRLRDSRQSWFVLVDLE